MTCDSTGISAGDGVNSISSIACETTSSLRTPNSICPSGRVPRRTKVPGGGAICANGSDTSRTGAFGSCGAAAGGGAVAVSAAAAIGGWAATVGAVAVSACDRVLMPKARAVNQVIFLVIVSSSMLEPVHRASERAVELAANPLFLVDPRSDPADAARNKRHYPGGQRSDPDQQTAHQRRRIVRHAHIPRKPSASTSRRLSIGRSSGNPSCHSAQVSARAKVH